ncbi:helix-turn-helix domain-containing protein, partial [Ethanoligenens sp.]|uniref:helix-turn-helix domain-containing protein n=1 Tax=Ethanoligenens sp. TaxID=2099655 RepID=UPI0039E896CF
MTIGEKIRYFREQRGITQGRLAEVTGIHPVSIRKYETNKMQPQPPQIERIAAALCVSSNALTGLDNAGLRLETIGDLMGIIIILC